MIVISDMDDNYQKFYPIKDNLNEKEFMDFFFIDYFRTFSHFRHFL